MNETEHYIEGAREVIRAGAPTVQTTQSGTRTVAFLRGGDRVIVHIDGAGNAVIATYMPKKP